MGVWEKQLPLTFTIYEQCVITVANKSLKSALIYRTKTNFVNVLSLTRDRLHSRTTVKANMGEARRRHNSKAEWKYSKTEAMQIGTGSSLESGWDGAHSHTAVCTAPFSKSMFGSCKSRISMYCYQCTSSACPFQTQVIIACTVCIFFHKVLMKMIYLIQA